MVAIDNIGQNQIEEASQVPVLTINVVRAWNKFVLFTTIFGIYLIILIIMLTMYYPVFNQKCDLEQKIWSIVCSVILASRVGTKSVEHYRIFNRVRIGDNNDSNPHASDHPLFDLFIFCWFIYGMFVIFSNDAVKRCNKISTTWCYVGWSYLALLYFYPCILMVLLSPIILLFLRVSWIRDNLMPVIMGNMTPSNNQTPVPQDIMSKLKSEKYSSLMKSAKMLHISNQQTPNLIVDPPTVNTMNSPHMINNTLGGTVSSFLNRINHTNTAQKLDIMFNNASVPSVSSSNNLICPICVAEFDPDDMVLSLPCNPKIHIFHDKCIREWFLKSQLCPMCRNNIVNQIRNIP